MRIKANMETSHTQCLFVGLGFLGGEGQREFLISLESFNPNYDFSLSEILPMSKVLCSSL